MNKIICMASAKGGSGKTVLTATFAAFLVSLGKRVLIVDVDASTNGLTLMYLKETMLQEELSLSAGKKAAGVYELSDKRIDPTITILNNGVHLIPSTYSFINTEDVDVNTFKLTLINLKNLIYEDYDFVFLDAQAGSDHFAESAMKKDISHEVVIVSEYDPLSAAGVERLKALFREDLTYNRTWVLLNKMLPDFVQSFSDFLEVAKYLSPIPWDAEVVKAYSRRKLALDLEWGNDYTIAIMQTLRSLFGDDIKKDLDKWILDKVSFIKEPIETQYNDTSKLLSELLQHQKYQLRYTAKKELYFRIIYYSFILFAVCSTGFLVKYLFEGRSLPISSSFLTAIAIPITLISMVLALILDYRKKRTQIETDTTSSKVLREIQRLEDQLLRLTNLKSSSPEELIKINNKNKA